MTPEALSVYLSRFFDQDTVQDTLVKYLTTTTPIRYPKAWGYRTARNLQYARYRSPATQVPLVDDAMAAQTPTPLQVAAARQALDRYAANPTVTTKPRKGKDRRGQPLTRPELWGYREDYKVLRETR